MDRWFVRKKVIFFKVELERERMSVRKSEREREREGESLRSEREPTVGQVCSSCAPLAFLMLLSWFDE